MSKFPYPVPYMVQRLTMTSKDRNLRFFKRHETQYMGSSQFETGVLPQAVRAITANMGIGEVTTHGVPTLVLFNTQHYTLETVEQMLVALWEDKHHLLEPHEYERSNPHRYKLDPAGHDSTNAWMEVEGGLYWTQVRCNIKDVERSLRIQVEFYDMVKDETARLGAEGVVGHHFKARQWAEAELAKRYTYTPAKA